MFKVCDAVACCVYFYLPTSGRYIHILYVVLPCRPAVLGLWSSRATSIHDIQHTYENTLYESGCSSAAAALPPSFGSNTVSISWAVSRLSRAVARESATVTVSEFVAEA